MASESKHLKSKFTGAVLALIMAFVVAGTATFAWYIYNTSGHTTTVNISASSSARLQICDTKDGEYKYSIKIGEHKDGLIPVSTNKIQYGFQHVTEFHTKSETDPTYVARIFADAPESDYYTHEVYLKSAGTDLDVYIGDIKYDDSEKDKKSGNTISSAIRVGFVMYDSEDKIVGEKIFEINQNGLSEEKQSYNTWKGKQGDVLDLSPGKKGENEITSEVEILNASNYFQLNDAGKVVGNPAKLGECKKGVPSKVKIYVWMEGCDQDCTYYLKGTTLENIAIDFVGSAPEK